jgi:hypothetical protein
MTGHRPVVLISTPILAGVQAALEAQGWTVAKRWELTDAEASAVRAVIHAGEVPLESEFLARLPKLGLIACVSVGYDGLDVPAARARGVEVTHAKGLNAGDVADHAIGLMISAWRNIGAGDRSLRAGGWRNDPLLAPPPSLNGRYLGVVGLGAIGEAVARRAEAFGLIVSWWGPNPKRAAWPRAESLIELAQASDILVVCSRAEASNRGLISQAVIEAVGPKGLIVNVARLADRRGRPDLRPEGRAPRQGGARRLRTGADASGALGRRPEHGAHAAHRRRHHGLDPANGRPGAGQHPTLLRRRDAGVTGLGGDRSWERCWASAGSSSRPRTPRPSVTGTAASWAST